MDREQPGQSRKWMTRAACRNSEPELFVVHGKSLSAGNAVALALCGGCPVRTECRDMYLTAGRNSGIVAGGWWWDCDGRAHCADGDGAHARRRRIDDRVQAARKAVTAARAKLANPNLTYDVAAARYGTNVRAVCDAVAIGRYAPELLHRVWDGRQTLASALAEANRRRAAARPSLPRGPRRPVQTSA